MSFQVNTASANFNQVVTQLESFKKAIEHEINDINLPFDNPAKAVFLMLIDTFKIFTGMQKRITPDNEYPGPTIIYLPKAIEIMLDMFLTRQYDKSWAGLRNTKTFLGCTIIFDAPSFSLK